MTLNKQSGNMYSWVTHTWNPIKGKCPHECSYCYMKRFPQGELRLDEKALNDNFGEGKIIFVGSSTDMFADEIPNDWIAKVLMKCRNQDENIESASNIYLFQSKNPRRMINHKIAFNTFPEKSVFGTTIETNRDYKVSKAPTPIERAEAMYGAGRKMVSIEPIMDFDLDEFAEMIKNINPEFVSIGADSKNSNLPEPSWDKVEKLIKELSKITRVVWKHNLNRLKE